MSLPSSEQWRPVVGYEGLYEVSDHGRVRSLDRQVLHKGKLINLRGCIRKLGPSHPDGRLGLTLYRGTDTRRLWQVSVLVARAFIGPPPSPGMYVCHNDGDPTNNVPTNLRYDTQSGNMFDKVAHGRCYQRAKTRCPRRHLLIAPNLVVADAARGHRSCLACARARAAQHLARRRGQDLDLVASADLHYAKIMAAA